MADLSAIDKRQYMRYSVSDNKNPVGLEPGHGIEGLH